MNTQSQQPEPRGTIAAAAANMRPDAVTDLRRPPMNSGHAPAPHSRGTDLGLPLGITIASMLAWALFQGWVLWGERANLEQMAAAQQQQMDASGKVRQQLDAVASGMQRLATAGNANASLVVDELRKRGVTITPGNAGQK